MGWGLPEKPYWDQWAFIVKTSPVIRLFIAVDLYENIGDYGRMLFLPNSCKGSGRGYKTWETHCKLFLDNCFVCSIAPYGMRRIPKEDCLAPDLPKINRYLLTPGTSEEIEIVRLIFSLFVDHGYTLTEISNLLNAQGVKAPHVSKTWRMRKIKSMILSATYIGSNQYGACIKHDVWPALIERSTFCAALAKIYDTGVYSTD